MKSDPRKQRKVVRFEAEPQKTLAMGTHPRIAKSTQQTSPLTINEKLYLRSLVIPKIVITRSASFEDIHDDHHPKLRRTVSLTDLKRSIDAHDLAEQLAGVGLSSGNPWKDGVNFNDNVTDTFKNIKIMKKPNLQIQ